MNAHRKDRIEELEGQIKDELDRRISIQVSEFRQRAQTLFKGEEYELFTRYLDCLLNGKPEEAPEGSDRLIKAFKADAKAQAIFSKLEDILRLKDMANEVSEIDGPGASKKIQPRLNQEPIYLPSRMPPAAKRDINTTDELREAISDTVKGLSQLVPDTSGWLGWMIMGLECLDKQAEESEKQAEYEQILERLMDMISNRLYNKRW